MGIVAKGARPGEAGGRALLRTILSTYTTLLRLDIDLATGRVDAVPIHHGRGVYFGITRAGGDYLVAARNLDPDGRKRDETGPTNAIYRLDAGLRTMTPLIEHPILHDLHQIRSWGRTLFVILGRGSSLALFDIPTRRLRRVIDLSAAVPDDMPRHEPINGDAFHMNSVSFAGGRLFVLAHNWDQPSFALEFALPRLAWPGTLRLVAVHRELGRMAHDIVRTGGRLTVIDSGNVSLRLRAPGGPDRDVNIPSATFPRGLSVTRENILVGCGQYASERAAREAGATGLVILDRRTLDVRFDVTLGDFGNPADILTVSEPDLTDRDPSPSRGLPRRLGASRS